MVGVGAIQKIVTCEETLDSEIHTRDKDIMKEEEEERKTKLNSESICRILRGERERESKK